MVQMSTTCDLKQKLRELSEKSYQKLWRPLTEKFQQQPPILAIIQ